MSWNQAMQDDHADDRDYGDYHGEAGGHRGEASVEAWVARGRMKEMQAKGWRALGPIREDTVWMRGPDPDAGPKDGVWKPLAVPAAAAVAAQRLRLRAAAAVALRRPHGRRVA